jgi:hypothetical protein
LSPGKRPRHTTRYSPCQRTTSSTNARKVREQPSGQRSLGILNTSHPADDLFSIAFPVSWSPPDKQTCATIGPSSSTLSSTFTGTLTATNPTLPEASAQTRSKDSETLGSPPWLIFIVFSGLFKRGHLALQRETIASGESCASTVRSNDHRPNRTRRPKHLSRRFAFQWSHMPPPPGDLGPFPFDLSAPQRRETPFPQSRSAHPTTSSAAAMARVTNFIVPLLSTV